MQLQTAIILQVSTILGGVAALWFFVERIASYRHRENVTFPRDTEQIPTRAALSSTQGRYLEIFICGLSAMAGALVWYGFGMIGSYVWLPLMVLISYILRHTSVIKRGVLKDGLMFGTFLAVFGHILIFCAAVVIAVRRGGLYVDGVAVFPLMRTTAGLLVAVAVGIVAAVSVMIPVKAGQG